jgi:hypothetical protein
MAVDLKGKKVFVITNPELGWDCVTGVYLAESEEALIEYLGKEYDEEMDIIHSESLKEVITKSEIRNNKINEVCGPVHKSKNENL